MNRTTTSQGGGLFTITLDSRVADTPNTTGFDTRPLLDHFGNDVTWRKIINAEIGELYEIKGIGERTVDLIHGFISQNIQCSFEDFLQDT